MSVILLILFSTFQSKNKSKCYNKNILHDRPNQRSSQASFGLGISGLKYYVAAFVVVMQHISHCWVQYWASLKAISGSSVRSLVQCLPQDGHMIDQQFAFVLQVAMALRPVLRTSLNTSEMIWKMPDVLIVITDFWLIWLFKRICGFD